MILREPIVGWRQWNFMYPHFLANLGNDTIYVPREKIEARCEQEDQSEQQARARRATLTPAESCTALCAGTRWTSTFMGAGAT